MFIFIFNITITIVDYTTSWLLENGLYPHFKVEPTQFGPTERDRSYL
jgi:hypothetical protein